MTKIVFGKRPAPFPITAKAVGLDGVELELTAICRYHTQKEYAALIDRMVGNDVPKKADDAAPDDSTVSDSFDQGQSRNAAFLLAVIEKWDIEGFDVNIENLTKLCDEVPAIVDALKEQYRAACISGKLGN